MYSFKFIPIYSCKYSMCGFVGRRGSVLWFGGFRPEGRGKQSFYQLTFKKNQKFPVGPMYTATILLKEFQGNIIFINSTFNPLPFD